MLRFDLGGGKLSRSSKLRERLRGCTAVISQNHHQDNEWPEKRSVSLFAGFDLEIYRQ
jgi:hypothetical protein